MTLYEVWCLCTRGAGNDSLTVAFRARSRRRSKRHKPAWNQPFRSCVSPGLEVDAAACGTVYFSCTSRSREIVMSSAHTRRALVVGATGIAGQTVSQELMRHGWEVHGLARRTDRLPEGVHPVRADLLDAEATRAAVAGIRPEIVIITAWIRKDTEAENIEVNSRTLRNLFAALEPDGGVRHVALLTGLKHYLGPVRGLRHRREGRNPVPRVGAPAAEPQLLLRAGGRALRGRRAPGIHVERPPLAHDPGLRGRQRHEHGADALGVRHDLQGARPAVRLPRIGRAVELHHGRDGCRPARRAARLGCDPPRGGERGVQHRERRRVPLALAVAADRRALRPRVGGADRHSAHASKRR